MSSVEGMWKFQSASIDDPDTLRWGGIVVLESGKVFGGDSVMAYLGSYEMDRDEIVARVRSWRWNHDTGEVENVFKMSGDIDHHVTLKGQRKDATIKGTIEDDDMPGILLAVRFEKIAELP